MPYFLTIHGGGTLGLTNGVYEGGPHEVDEDIAAEAASLGYDWVHVETLEVDEVIPDELIPVEPVRTGPLTLKDFEPPAPPPAEEEPPPPPPNPDLEPVEFPCAVEGCTKVYKTEAALTRHVERNHAPGPEEPEELETEPEDPEQPEEPAKENEDGTSDA